MSPKEKADELFGKFYYIIPSFELPIDDHLAKECALIAVHEILGAIDWDYYEGSDQTEHSYWKEVIQEIHKL